VVPEEAQTVAPVEEQTVAHQEDFGYPDPPPQWAQRMFEDLHAHLRGLRNQLGTLQFGEEFIMAAVQIEQGDLDAVASTLEALVGVIAGLDTTKLAPADETALNQALADVTSAVNSKLPVTVTEPPASGGDTPVDGGDAPVGDPPVDGGTAPDAGDGSLDGGGADGGTDV
jgi:hypothetical protein